MAFTERRRSVKRVSEVGSTSESASLVETTRHSCDAKVAESMGITWFSWMFQTEL